MAAVNLGGPSHLPRQALGLMDDLAITEREKSAMRRLIGLMAIVLLLGAAGCAATQEAKSVEKSGFLGDYSLLKKGERSTFKEVSEDQALWIYKNPNADWRKYRKVWLDSVTIWMSQKAVSYTHLRAHETGRNLVCR